LWDEFNWEDDEKLELKQPALADPSAVHTKHHIPADLLNVIPEVIKKLVLLSHDLNLACSTVWFWPTIQMFDRDGHELLLRLYEESLNINSVTHLLKSNATGKKSKEDTVMSGCNLYSKRTAIERLISKEIEMEYKFVSITHFVIFYIANDGYARSHRASNGNSNPKRGWNILPKRIKDGYVAIGLKINKVHTLATRD